MKTRLRFLIAAWILCPLLVGIACEAVSQELTYTGAPITWRF